MKQFNLFSLATLFFILRDFSLAISLNCGRVKNVRKNWVDCSSQQQADFISTYLSLMFKTTVSGGSEYLVNYYTKLHANYGGGIHGTSLFFPWHRFFLSHLERKLQEKANRNDLFLPYWDWSLESQSLGTSPIWKSFGGNGEVRSGNFANLRVDFPKPHIISRQFNGGSSSRNPIGAAASFSMIEKYLDFTDYKDFKDGIEYIHGTVHVVIGGDMGNVVTSPNDPIFYLHHCFVDKIWWRWQVRGHSKKFAGINYFNSKGVASKKHERAANVKDILYPFTDWKVEDVFNTEALCYTYSLTREEQYDDQISTQPGGNKPPPSSSTGGGGGALNVLSSLFLVPPVLGKPSGGGKPSPTEVVPADENVRIIALSQLSRNDDSIELFKVKPFTPVTPEWIRLNNLNPDIASAIEETNRKFVQDLDKVKGFISPSSLYNNLELWIGLVAAGARNFKATINQGVILLRIPDSEMRETTTMRVYLMQNRLLKTIRADKNLLNGFKDVANEIEEVIQVTKF